MTFFLHRSIFFWYLLITLTLTHLVLLIDRYIAKYEIDTSDILLGPLATEYRVLPNIAVHYVTVSILFMMTTLCTLIDLTSLNYKVKLSPFCSALVRDFGRILLIICVRLSDILCAFSLAFCAIHKVSPIALPILLVAVLLFIPLSANFKTIACFLSTYYVLVITLFKLIFDAYEGFIDYPNFCNVPRLIEWLYWIGLISDDARPALAPVICICTLTVRSSLQHIKKMYGVRYSKTLPILPFPDVDCTNADKGISSFVKFYTNFILYKFSYEMYMTVVLLSAVVASNIISLLSLIGLVICLLIDRWRIRRIFLVFVCYHLVVLIYSLLAYIGPPPGECYYGIPIHPDYAPYFAFINNGQYTVSSQRKSSYAIYCYFLNVGISIIQYHNFKIEFLEGNNAGGGSNDGILLALHRKESLEYNPVPHFYSVHVKILDELKQCVCSYYHWFVLLFLLSDGIRLSSPVLSVVLIILAFINLWRGADLYLSHPTVFIRKWRLITIYLLAAISIRIAALIADGLLGHFLTYDKTKYSISYMSFHVMLSYFSSSSEDNTSTSFLLLLILSERRDEKVFVDKRMIKNAVIIGTFNAVSLIYELIELYVIGKGVVLQTQLIYKAMTYHQLQDRRRLAKIKRTIETMTKVNLPFGEWFIESIRGWNENLLHIVDTATENMEEATFSSNSSVSEIRNEYDDRTKENKKTKTPYITISALFSACALWLARKTLGYRYIRFVINEEKRLLLEKLPEELSLVSQDSLSKLEKCNLGNEICLVTNSRDIIKYMNEVHDRWLKLPLLWRLLNAIGTFWVCNTALLCYLAIIVAHGQAACLFTFPLTILVFFWGAISERKRRLLWTIAIFYVQIMIIVSLYFKYTSLPWICKDSKKCGRWSMAVIGQFVGIADEPISVATFCFLILALFTHRHNMRASYLPIFCIRYLFLTMLISNNNRNGFWYASTTQLLQNEDNKKCCLWSVLLDILRLRQRSPSNYYSWMILSDLFALIILIVNFSNFDLARRSAFTLLESNSSLLPDSFVYYFMASLGMASSHFFIVLDRIIYLKRAIRAKFVYLVVEVIVVHVYILIILLISSQTDENRRMTSGLFIWYIARGVHMLSSAFQVRDGYPKFIVGDTMMKSNPISWALYVGYFYTVPVFEIATILDWTFTSTTLTLMDFYILKTINYYLYFIKGMRKFEAFYPRKRAELTSVSAKIFLGGGILLAVFVILVMLILFISENMFVGIFLPVQMVFTLRIDKHPVGSKFCFQNFILYEYHLEDLPLISDREYNHLIKYFAFDMYAQNFIKSLGAETIVEATLPSRGMIHYVHPDWKVQLMQLVNETTDGLKLKSRIYLRRMRIQEQRDNLLKKTDTTPLETAREWEMEMERQEVQDLSDVHGMFVLIQVLRSTNCSDAFEMDISEIVRPLITVPNAGLMYEYPIVGEEQFIDGFAYFNYTFKYMTKLILKPYCTDNQTPVEGVSIPHVVMFEQYGVGHDGTIIAVAGALRFLFFVYKVSSSYLRLLNISTPSLVMTFAMVYLISFKLRDILMTKPFELTFRELGDPNRLIRLCSSINIGNFNSMYTVDSRIFNAKN
uniref:Piezo_RRas_bdg domain-containing protein n=1 Tax=Onchocerca volvulus TaxID=6282 RepID=A0A8R1U0Y7_ONCVO